MLFKNSIRKTLSICVHLMMLLITSMLYVSCKTKILSKSARRNSLKSGSSVSKGQTMICEPHNSHMCSHLKLWAHMTWWFMTSVSQQRGLFSSFFAERTASSSCFCATKELSWTFSHTTDAAWSHLMGINNHLGWINLQRPNPCSIRCKSRTVGMGVEDEMCDTVALRITISLVTYWLELITFLGWISPDPVSERLSPPSLSLPGLSLPTHTSTQNTLVCFRSTFRTTAALIHFIICMSMKIHTPSPSLFESGWFPTFWLAETHLCGRCGGPPARWACLQRACRTRLGSLWWNWRETFQSSRWEPPPTSPPPPEHTGKSQLHKEPHFTYRYSMYTLRTAVSVTQKTAHLLNAGLFLGVTSPWGEPSESCRQLELEY